MKYDYDAIVLGAGSAGLTAASGLEKIGKKVLLVEREQMGGECTNTGCIPSKALLHHAEQFYVASRVAGKNKKTDAYRNEAFTYVRSIIDEVLSHETPEVLVSRGIDVVMGEAEFVAPRSIAVNEVEYGFKHAIIATGSSPRQLDIPGVEEKDILTNQNLFSQTTIPKRLLIVGAGPIGLEMGQAFAMLGSAVTIVEDNERFASHEDKAISPVIAQVFAELGITVHLSATVSEVQNKLAIIKPKSDQAENNKDVAVAFDKILYAVGRVPNVPQGLPVARVEIDGMNICVNSQYLTTNKSIYAIGDVISALKFTHTADDAARQVVMQIATFGLWRVNTQKAIPKVTYTHPEIAAVGLTYEAALAKYKPTEIIRLEVPFSQNDRAVTESNTTGLAVVIARRLTGTVLGAHIIGPRAGELITTFTLAIDKKLSLWSLGRTIYAYPTYSLIIKKIAGKFVAEQLHTLRDDLTALLIRQLPKLMALAFWLTLVYSFQSYKISNELTYQELALQLYAFFTTSMYGPAVYIALYALRPLIFFPATLLTALSGALFGLWGGILYTIVGENLSANFAYWIGRFFGNNWKLEDSVIGNWVEALRRRPFESVLFMRLFYFPFDFTNYSSGLLKVRWIAYALATLIGIMPGLVTFVSLGAAIDIEAVKMDGITFNAFDPRYLALSVSIFAVSVVLARLLKRWKAKK